MRLSLAAPLVLTLCCGAQSPPVIPDNLRPPMSESMVQSAAADGDQVYLYDGTGWTLKGPEAKLRDESGAEVGGHFTGPTWQWSDSSSVTGEVVASATPDPDSIPWLLLKAARHQGEGLMKRVSFIQRISTRGGKAPLSGCNASNKNAEIRSHYTAVYYFYAHV